MADKVSAESRTPFESSSAAAGNIFKPDRSNDSWLSELRAPREALRLVRSNQIAIPPFQPYNDNNPFAIANGPNQNITVSKINPTTKLSARVLPSLSNSITKANLSPKSKILTEGKPKHSATAAYIPAFTQLDSTSVLEEDSHSYHRSLEDFSSLYTEDPMNSLISQCVDEITLSCFRATSQATKNSNPLEFSKWQSRLNQYASNLTASLEFALARTSTNDWPPRYPPTEEWLHKIFLRNLHDSAKSDSTTLWMRTAHTKWLAACVPILQEFLHVVQNCLEINGRPRSSASSPSTSSEEKSLLMQKLLISLDQVQDSLSNRKRSPNVTPSSKSRKVRDRAPMDQVFSGTTPHQKSNSLQRKEGDDSDRRRTEVLNRSTVASTSQTLHHSPRSEFTNHSNIFDTEDKPPSMSCGPTQEEYIQSLLEKQHQAVVELRNHIANSASTTNNSPVYKLSSQFLTSFNSNSDYCNSTSDNPKQTISFTSNCIYDYHRPLDNLSTTSYSTLQYQPTSQSTNDKSSFNHTDDLYVSIDSTNHHQSTNLHWFEESSSPYRPVTSRSKLSSSFNSFGQPFNGTSNYDSSEKCLTKTKKSSSVSYQTILSKIRRNINKLIAAHVAESSSENNSLPTFDAPASIDTLANSNSVLLLSVSTTLSLSLPIEPPISTSAADNIFKENIRTLSSPTFTDETSDTPPSSIILPCPTFPDFTRLLHQSISSTFFSGNNTTTLDALLDRFQFNCVIPLPTPTTQLNYAPFIQAYFQFSPTDLPSPQTKNTLMLLSVFDNKLTSPTHFNNPTFSAQRISDNYELSNTIANISSSL